MLTVEVDVAAELPELSVRGGQELMDCEANRRMRWVKFEGFIRSSAAHERRGNKYKPAQPKS